MILGCMYHYAHSVKDVIFVDTVNEAVKYRNYYCICKEKREIYIKLFFIYNLIFINEIKSFFFSNFSNKCLSFQHHNFTRLCINRNMSLIFVQYMLSLNYL